MTNLVKMVTDSSISFSSSQPDSVFTVEEKPKANNGKTDFETAISLCGYGRFHYGFVTLCGMMFFCVGCQNGANAYILPSAECDLNLKSEEKGLLNVAFLIGGVISALFWGICADTYGRKKIIVATLLIDSILTFVSSFSQSFQVLVAFRAISGFTIGAPGALIYTYLGEFHSSKQRVKAICYVGFFWTLSWLVLPGLAWIIIPMRMSLEIAGFRYKSWQLFLALIGLPSFVISFVLMTYPESPKFLLSRGKNTEALSILRRIYASNMDRSKSDYPVKELWASEEESGDIKEANDDVSKTSDGPSSLLVVIRLLKNAWLQVQALASPPLSYYAILCWVIYFTNMFGYYGLGLWMPELFNRFENFYKLHPNEMSVSVCELVSSNETITINQLSCEHRTMDEKVFIDTLTINGVCLLGNFISGYFADRVGRRTMPVTLTAIAGLAGIAIYFVSSSKQILMVACIFSLTITAANFVISSIVVDIFPTYVGALAICMVTLFGRVGAIASNLAFGMLLDISCEVPIFLVAGIVLSGAALALLLPPSKT